MIALPKRSISYKKDAALDNIRLNISVVTPKASLTEPAGAEAMALPVDSGEALIPKVVCLVVV